MALALFSGDMGDYIDVGIIKITIKTNQIDPRGGGGWTWHSYRQGSAELNISEPPKKYFATERKPEKYFPKSETLKYTLLKHNSLSEC